MLEIYKLISSQLSTLNIPVFADLYPLELADNKIFPYIIFNFPSTLNKNYSDLNLMEIDIWDNKTSIVEIETIAKQVDDIFKRLKVNDVNMFAQTFRNNPYRLKLDEEENGIQRRQMRYIVKAMYKK